MTRTTTLSSSWRTLWASLAEPTLVRRSVVSVSIAFVLVWAVLLTYNFINYKQSFTQDPGLMKYGDALLDSLTPYTDPAQATAAVASTNHWTNIRRRQIGLLPGVAMHELRDSATGLVVYAPPGLEELNIPPPEHDESSSISEPFVQGQHYRVYAGRNGRWALRIIQIKRSDTDFLHSSGRNLVPYLLLAAPFVLLPVWLSVRAGLKPLQQLARRIAQRNTDDLQPVGFNARHRELKPLEQSLDTLLARMRQKVERERAFVQDAAHEIRTPLAVITAQAHVMARSQSEEERTQAQAHLEQAIARTSHLAQQLLDLAALDEAQRPAPRDLDVAQWLRAAMAQAAPQAMAQQIELSLDAPDTLPAQLDLPALESIVHNLIDNAVRYATSGGNVAVGLRHDVTLLHLVVQDDGPGIPITERSRIFERFYRGVGHVANGSGLGLAIVQQAVRRMGGQVQVGDGLNSKGVGFFVSIPLPRSG
jgi:two-component system, OmpR family, sensor histidine kinase QseC